MIARATASTATATVTALVLVATAGASERHYEKDFPVDAGARLSLDSHKGMIRIQTHERPVISVRARIHDDGGQDTELVDKIEIRERASQRRVALEVEYPSRTSDNGWFGKGTTLPLVDWDISVPADTELRLDSHKSEFDVEAPGGRIAISSHKGRGTIRGVRNDLELETHKGEFRVAIELLRDLAVSTHKGDVEIEIRGASSFEIRGHSHKGQLVFTGWDVPVTRDGRESGVDYTAGSGESAINLSTHKGKIELQFVD